MSVHNNFSSKKLLDCIFLSKSSFYNRLLPYYEEFMTGNKAVLEPNSTADKILSELMDVIRTYISPCEFEIFFKKIPKDKERLYFEDKAMTQVDRLRLIFGLSETEYERFFLKKIDNEIESTLIDRENKGLNSKTRIEKFNEIFKTIPRLKHYENFVVCELNLLVSSYNMNEKSILNYAHGNQFPNLENKIISFLGSGAMPLTAILMHIYSGININLIEINEESAKESKHFIEKLERLGIIYKNALRVFCHDAAKVQYINLENHKNTHANLSNKKNLLLDTDAILMAIMIPNKTKKIIIRNIDEHIYSPNILLIRTVYGLPRLRYESLNAQEVESATLSFHTEAMPKIYADKYHNNQSKKSISPFIIESQTMHSTQSFISNRSQSFINH